MRSVENMAKTALETYLYPQYDAEGWKSHDGFSLDMAIEKAISSKRSLAREIRKVAEQYR